LCWRLFVLTSVSLGLSSYWQFLPLSSIVYPFLLAVLSSDVPFSGSSFSWQLSSWQFGISISSNLLLRHISFFLQQTWSGLAKKFRPLNFPWSDSTCRALMFFLDVSVLLFCVLVDMVFAFDGFID
jgi:hypothetical protein